MPFWLVFGVNEKMGSGSGQSAQTVGTPYETMDAAREALRYRPLVKVSGTVTEANAYVVEAPTASEAGNLVMGVLTRGESYPQVHLIATDIPTEWVYHPIADPDSPAGALLRVEGEIGIARQIAAALDASVPEDDRALITSLDGDLERYERVVRGLVAVREGQADAVPPPDAGAREGSVQFSSPTTAGKIEALTGELSILRHEGQVARKLLTAPERAMIAGHQRAVDAFLDATDGRAASQIRWLRTSPSDRRTV